MTAGLECATQQQLLLGYQLYGEQDKPLEKAAFPWSSVLTTTLFRGDEGLEAREELHGNRQTKSTPEVKDILVLVVPVLDTCWPSTEPQPRVLDNTEVTALELEIAAPG